MANSKFVELWCKRKVQEMKNKVIDDLSNDIERTARLHFNRAVKEVPADDPYVVVSKQIKGNSFTITCSGEQVLFIEFGAGITHSTKTSTVLTDSNNILLEYASRPYGIVGIGEYGHHYGKNDWWIYLSTTGRVSKNTTRFGMNNRGEFKMKTSGIRPVRALYLAVGSGVRKITQRKIIRR